MVSEAVETAVAPEARAQGKPLRIGLFGGFGIGNFGNDASLEAVLGYLRAKRPDADITCICTKPDVVAQKFGLPTVTTGVRPRGVWRILDTLLLRQPSVWINWAKCLAALGRFDVVVVAGTGTFDDYRDTPMGWPSRLLRWVLAARLRGVRWVFLSVGAGPIVNPISRVLMKKAAQLAQYRSYRDANSRHYMQGIGVDESNSPVLPDIAFLLPTPPHQDRPEGAPLTVGVGIMDYHGWDKGSPAIHQDYMEKHARFIEWLEAEGHKVRVLVGQTTDWAAVHAMEERLGRKLADSEDMASFHDAMAKIAETDIVVASRFHVQIAALKLGRPLISLSYAPKNDDLLAAAGLADFTQNIDAIDLDLLKRHFTTLAGERARYAGIVRAHVGAMEERLRATLDELDLLGDR